MRLLTAVLLEMLMKRGGLVSSNAISLCRISYLGTPTSTRLPPDATRLDIPLYPTTPPLGRPKAPTLVLGALDGVTAARRRASLTQAA